MGHRAARIAILLALTIAPVSARADMGPRFEEPRITVKLTFQGKPLSEPFEAIVLKPQPVGDGGAESENNLQTGRPWVKEIPASALTDPDGTRWVPPSIHSYQTFPDFSRSQVTFRFRPDREFIPPRARIAIYLAAAKRVVITDSAPTRPYITELAADILSDYTASLVVTPRWPVAVVLSVLSENVPSLALALVVTTLLELLVVAVCAWFYKGERVPRLYRAAVLGNLITVPLVWFVSVYAKVELNPGGWPVMFILAEVTAALFEGWLYHRITRIPFPTALLWSALANNATLLVGCCLVAFTI